MTGKLKNHLDRIQQTGITPFFDMPPCKIEQWLKEMDAEGLQGRPTILLDTEKKIREKVFAGGWDDITNREWRIIPSCLWGEEPYLADHETIFEKIHVHYSKRNNGIRQINRLIGEYFYHYSPDKRNLHKLGNMIKRLIEDNSQAQEWMKKLFLFDPSKAHIDLAEVLMTNDYPISDVLSAIYEKWSKGNAVPFFANVFKELCKQSTRLTKLDEGHKNLLKEMMTWAIDEENDVLRYEVNRGELADALLCPFAQHNQESEFADRILKFMLKHYDDPRLHEGKWIGVSDSARSLMLQWLSKRSLDQFFHVVGRVAKASHWKYRRQFWKCYLNYDMEVWVVFADLCQNFSRRVFGEELKYGKFNGGSPQSNHAVLIMRIDSLIIADWSHDGACRMYSVNDPRAPKMYEDSYKVSDLNSISRHESGYFRHHNTRDNPYFWQPRFAQYIHNKTGIFIDEREYRLEQ